MPSRRSKNSHQLNFFQKYNRKLFIGFSPKLYFLLGGVIVFLISISVIFVQLRPANESASHEQKKIPKDVKQNLPKTHPSATLRIPIFMYHYVEYVADKKDTIRQSLDTPPHILDQQLQTLREAGYTFLTASDAAQIIDGKMPSPPKPIVITFDDGHWDLYTDALPILEKYQVHATAYIISGFIGGSDFLTSDQLRKVIKSGLVEIGAHTVHHIELKGKLLPLVEYEVDQSKKTLEDMYHVPVVSFAYPSGSFDQQAIDVVKADGFETAVSTIPGIAQSNVNRFFLYRLRPGYRTGQDLLNFLQQNTFNLY